VPVVLSYRVYRYRREFQYLLSNASTTRSRYLRLSLLSIFTVLIVLPAQIYALVVLSGFKMHKYSWSRTHHNWGEVIRIPSGGQLREWVHIIWVPCGYLVFLFFGFGGEARKMYVEWLKQAGVGKLFPSLLEERPPSQPGTGKTGLLSSMASKAKSLFTNSTVNSNGDSL
jgi:pheromone a factor receptor